MYNRSVRLASVISPEACSNRVMCRSTRYELNVSRVAHHKICQVLRNYKQRRNDETDIDDPTRMIPNCTTRLPYADTQIYEILYFDIALPSPRKLCTHAQNRAVVICDGSCCVQPWRWFVGAINCCCEGRAVLLQYQCTEVKH
jgi:hypothetical protein